MFVFLCILKNVIMTLIECVVVAEIASIASKCLAAVEGHDSAMEDNEALSSAQLKFDDILSSPSLEAAAKKIDTLVKNRELDSTLMLLITKAWAAAKESTMMKEEVGILRIINL